MWLRDVLYVLCVYEDKFCALQTTRHSIGFNLEAMVIMRCMKTVMCGSTIGISTCNVIKAYSNKDREEYLYFSELLRPKSALILCCPLIKTNKYLC